MARVKLRSRNRWGNEGCVKERDFGWKWLKRKEEVVIKETGELEHLNLANFRFIRISSNIRQTKF